MSAKTVMCKYITAEGGCYKGAEKCTFAHDVSQLEKSDKMCVVGDDCKQPLCMFQHSWGWNKTDGSTVVVDMSVLVSAAAAAVEASRAASAAAEFAVKAAKNAAIVAENVKTIARTLHEQQQRRRR